MFFIHTNIMWEGEKYALSMQLPNKPFQVEKCCFIYFLMNKKYAVKK